jgi:MFS transporter, DHA1 family, multidrug resistance protein
MIVAGIFFDGTPLPMIVRITICAVITFVIAQVTLSRSRDLAAAPAE